MKKTNTKKKNKNINITYLGPVGSTFSEMAYEKMSKIFGVLEIDDPNVNSILAKKNEEILPLVLKHEGCGVIAMETKANGRIDPPINSFIDLLEEYDDSCPLGILGGIQLEINFALMARPGMSFRSIKGIVGHPEALAACRFIIAERCVQSVESTSNGKAAEDVARNDAFAEFGALGPYKAAKTYGLEVLDKNFEDLKAITSFYLIGPKNLVVLPIKCNTERMLIVFKIGHRPGALFEVLRPLAESGINMRLIHSRHTMNGAYDFAIEIECDSTMDEKLKLALVQMKRQMDKFIQFGPFPVIAS
jgi:chorismate mutase/prephenate dehydratase